VKTATIDDAIADIGAGKFVIIVDDEDRENEGDLAIAADAIAPQAINFMAVNARGLICTAMEGSRLDELAINPMVDTNTSPLGTGFAVSVDAHGRGVTTGISASDRATTIRLLCDTHAAPADFSRPGHTFPLRAKSGGVLERAGQTEAIVDLCKLAGRYPAGVICEIANADGSMARRPQLERIAAEHGLSIVTIADLIAHRRRTEQLVSYIDTKHDDPGRSGRTKQPTRYASSVDVHKGLLSAEGLRLGIVVSRFNQLVTEKLLGGAVDALVRHGAADADITVVWVPGAFEIPLAARELIASRGVDAVVCLGAVVRGETAHFDYVAGAASTGIQAVAAETGVPVAMGVLTTDTMDQALDRAGGKSGNKGADAAVTAIEMVSLVRSLRRPHSAEREESAS
jgi:6,7-dimethyl-8-ribityllumazine synthase